MQTGKPEAERPGMIGRAVGWLESIGRNARIVLPAGVVLALLLPSSGNLLKPLVPWIIAILYATSMIRLDLKAALLGAVKPSRLMVNLCLSLILLVVVPVAAFAVASLAGLDEAILPVLTWYAVAPPIASTIWMCALLGLDLVLAMELVVLTSLLAPFTGPLLGSWLLGTAVPIDSVELCLRVTAMIITGAGLSILAKRWLGEDWIRRHPARLDGIAALAMMAFLLPVFDGTGVMVLQDPMLAAVLLGLAVLLNTGSQLVLVTLAWLRLVPRRAGHSLAVVSGNRNVGLYFAALPADPVMGLFTAMYQFPLYLTPLLMGVVRRLQPTSPDSSAT